jgi:L-ascorbate metabolism protein UlaG (beta-lactamase superfamily)
MQVEWFGQSAFSLSATEAAVFIDPFADMSSLAGRGMKFEYPPIEADGVDLLLVTHEHRGLIDRVERCEAPGFDTAVLPVDGGGPLAVVPAAP